MNKIKNLIVSTLMALLCGAALASNNPEIQQIEGQMIARNWQQAEMLAQSALAKKPNSPKLNYLLAQIHEQEGNPALALIELNKARWSDPALKFASPGASDRMLARLQPHSEVPAPVVQHNDRVTATPVQTPEKESQAFWYFMLFLVFCCCHCTCYLQV